MEDTVRSAVFGNVGTIITFRVSPDDSPFLVKYFEPQFEASDLSNFHNRNFVTSMSINGEKAAAFSGTTLNIPASQINNAPKIVEYSRKMFSAQKPAVEEMIRLQTQKKIIEPQKSAIPPIDKKIPTSITNRLLEAVTENSSEKISPAKKRRLRRKKQATSTAGTPVHAPQPITPTAVAEQDDTILRLR